MRAPHATLKQVVAVFEGLGLHLSVFCEGKENDCREGSERDYTEYATKNRGHQTCQC